VSSDILDAIKATFKSRPITIIVEEVEEYFELSTEMKIVLDERLQEDKKTYIIDKESLTRLNMKYGL
jgi:hypothetical protein